MSNMLDINSIEEYNVVKYMRHKAERRKVKGEQMNRVKEFRKELGISQLELAKDIGVSRQTINMIENDKYNPTLELCLNLARSLQTDLNSLFWEDDF